MPEDIPTVPVKKTGGLFRGLDVSETNLVPEEPPTRPARGFGQEGGFDPAFAMGGEPQTRIAVRVGETPSEAAEATQDTGITMVDPVVGWLVIVDGPGKGTGLKIGSGHNSVGRGPASRIRIDFGDDQISRERHAVVTYDPKGKCFYIGPGDSMNITYLNSKPVLGSERLESDSVLQLGSTELRFVAFCGESFSW